MRTERCPSSNSREGRYLSAVCYTAQLQLEVDALAVKWNKRILAEVRGIQKYYMASAFDRPQWPIVTAQQPEDLQAYQWGFVPPWAKDPQKIAMSTGNARVEEVFSKSTYREAAEEGWRCLVPVTGFYEHRHVSNGKLKIPYILRPKYGELWYLGGIYHPATKTYSILTTEANDLMAQIHNSAKRQPVIIAPVFHEAFLHDRFDQKQLADFCAPMPSEVMDYHTVSKLLTQKGVDRNVPAVAEPFDYPGLPPIHLAA